MPDVDDEDAEEKQQDEHKVHEDRTEKLTSKKVDSITENLNNDKSRHLK